MRTKALALLLLGAWLFGCGGKPDPAAAAKAGGRTLPVATATSQHRDVSVYLDGLGSLIAYRTVTVRPQVDGRLDQVFFKEGQAVKKGELLAQIDPRPFMVQLHQAEGALARDEAQLSTSKKDLERYDDLARQKLIAPQQADSQRGLVAQGEGVLQVDRAAVEAARLNLDYAHVVSPVDGVTGIRNVDPGNLVRASDPTGIVTVTQLDPIAVIFTLPQDVLSQVALHQAEGALEVAVFGRDGAAELGRGKLEVIDNSISSTTATMRLKAVLPNPTHSLWPNQFVKARLLLTHKKDALVIPAAALQRGPEGVFVYVVGADQTVQPRPVVVDLLQGDDALLAKGLEPDEMVVTEGQNQLKPGSKVSLRGAKGAEPEAGKPEAGAPAAGDGAKKGEHKRHGGAGGEGAPAGPGKPP